MKLKTAWIGNIGLFFNRNITVHHVCPLRFQISHNSIFMDRTHLYFKLLRGFTEINKLRKNIFTYSEWKIPKLQSMWQWSWEKPQALCCPREAPAYFQQSFAGSLFHCFTFLFRFIDWWIHLTKYKHPVRTHFMYILFSLIFFSLFNVPSF